MRSSHNLIKLAMFLILVLAVLFDYNRNQQIEITEVEEPVKVVKEVDKKQLQCLADNIYYEAGGESTEGKAAVARVVLNRMNHGGFGSTPCKVVYQSNHVKQTTDEDETFWVKVCQFSWVCEGKSNPNRNTHRYQTSLQIAKDVLIYDKYKEVIPTTVLFFHNLSVQPAIAYGFVKKIGNHIFYTKKRHGRTIKKSGERYVHNQRVQRDTQSES